MKTIQIRQMIDSFKDEFKASTADAGWTDPESLPDPAEFKREGYRLQALKTAWSRIESGLPISCLTASSKAWREIYKSWLWCCLVHERVLDGKSSPVPFKTVSPLVKHTWERVEITLGFVLGELEYSSELVKPVKPKPKRANNCTLVKSAIEQWKKANFRGCVIKAGVELPTYRMFCKMAGCAGHADQTDNRTSQSKAAYRELTEAFNDSLAAPKSMRLRG